MIVLDNRYSFGDIVYLITDVDQEPRMVTGIMACPGGDIIYEVVCGTHTSRHYAFELSIEKKPVGSV